MFKFLNVGIAVQIFLALIPACQVLAETCFKEHPISQSPAGAGMYSNFWERDGTVTAESRRLVAMADSLLSRPDVTSKGITYLFESKPTKYLTDYEEASICAERLRETTLQPLHFDKVSFDSADDVVDWFSDISQGSGEIGEKLYELCPGDCSPSYQLEISKVGDKLQVDTLVTCGHARDKDDNTYQVSLKESRKC